MRGTRSTSATASTNPKAGQNHRGRAAGSGTNPASRAGPAHPRTHPAHARKGAAKLKALGQPYYYFEDTTGGHSGGVDNDQRAKLQALQFIYLMQRLMAPVAGG